LKGTRMFGEPVVNWSTKRRWVAEAFEALERAGYTVRSAYTAVKDPSRTKFIYTDRLWQGADMVGLGVASFGHINGVHMQNQDKWDTYSDAVDRGEIPLSRAYRPTADERLIRELVLQLKLGSIRPSYFAEKYGADILQRFQPEFASLKDDGYLAEANDRIVALTREGLLRVDTLLPRFFKPEHVGIRYT
jgi:coproporphyrinogen III oxidase-like Fe-S oxidoreductase